MCMCMLHLVFLCSFCMFQVFLFIILDVFANFVLMLHYPKILFKKGQNVVPGIVGHYNV